MMIQQLLSLLALATTLCVAAQPAHGARNSNEVITPT